MRTTVGYIFITSRWICLVTGTGQIATLEEFVLGYV